MMVLITANSSLAVQANRGTGYMLVKTNQHGQVGLPTFQHRAEPSSAHR
jgi:hypothetical protein